MNNDNGPDSTHLVIIGGGSAAFAAAIEAHGLGARVTIINDGLPIGGTCVNVGCVPSKALLRAAEANHVPNEHRFAGIDSSSRLADFGEVIAQKRELVDSLRQAKYLGVIEPLEGVYGAGDVIGGPMFVYTAAYQGKLAAHNTLSDQPPAAVDYRPLPWVAFTDPQVAGVGLDERQAAQEGFEPQTTTFDKSVDQLSCCAG